MGTDIMNEEFNEEIENIDELVDFLVEIEEYLYNWCQIYTGQYNYVDHSKWPEKCLVLLQKYKFDLDKIKSDIINGTILIAKYHNDNPKLMALEEQLYDAHKKKVEEFENKYINK